MISTKTLQRSDDLYIQFSAEEVSELGWHPNEKLSVKLLEDGNISIEKFATLEIDLADLSKECLIHIINCSCEQDKSTNDIIVDLIRQGLQLPA